MVGAWALANMLAMRKGFGVVFGGRCFSAVSCSEIVVFRPTYSIYNYRICSSRQSATRTLFAVLFWP